jgi:hypothetical protein
MTKRAVPPGRAAALAKWRELLDELHYCVSCNARTVLQLALEHAEELHTAGVDLVRLDDAVRVDLGGLRITESLAGKFTVEALGEEVFAADASGPLRGRWGAWLVILAALARELEERFPSDRPRRGHLH